MRLLFLYFVSLNCFLAFPQQVIPTVENEEEVVTFDTGPAPAPLDFPEDKINQYREQPDFNYSERTAQDNWWTMFKRYVGLQWNKFINWLFGDLQEAGFLIYLIEILPYLVLLGFLMFTLWLFGKLNPAGSLLSSPHAAEVALTEEEKIVKTQNIRKLIEDAVQNGDYRLAVRYHYLLILQQLSKNGFIKYEFSKTDEDYLTEVDQEHIKGQFRKLTRIYDFVWYGNFVPGGEDYYKISKEFKKMEELTGAKNEHYV